MCVFSWQLFYTCLLYFSSLIILIIIIYVSRRIYVRLNFKAICLHILYKNIFSFCFLSINIYEEKLVVGRLYSSWKVLKILFMRNLCKNEHDFDFWFVYCICCSTENRLYLVWASYKFERVILNLYNSAVSLYLRISGEAMTNSTISRTFFRIFQVCLLSNFVKPATTNSRHVTGFLLINELSVTVCPA